MSVLTDTSVIIEKAASRVRGDRLIPLFELCESQKTVSTGKLLLYVNQLAASDRQDGLHFKAIADYIRKQDQLEDAAETAETLRLGLLAAKHLLLAAKGPEGGPTDWNETLEKWLVQFLPDIDAAQEKLARRKDTWHRP